MRKYSFVNKKETKIKKVMLFSEVEWTYVFEYDTIDDKHCIGDCWFETLDEALQYSNERYWISDNDWVSIGNPKDWCFHDIIKDLKMNS